MGVNFIKCIFKCVNLEICFGVVIVNNIVNFLDNIFKDKFLLFGKFFKYESIRFIFYKMDEIVDLWMLIVWYW